MYLNKVKDEEKIKRILGIDIYTIALLEINTQAFLYIQLKWMKRLQNRLKFLCLQ